jgi:thioester reductase-like protein
VKTYFLTGATGVVGSAVAARVIAEGDARLILLLRAGSDSELASRLTELWRFWAQGHEPSGNRVEAVRGDITQPNLGMEQAAYDRIVRECTHIIHCAASVRMNLPIDEARRSAVLAAQSILALGEIAQASGILEKIEYVSTVGVGGRRPGPLPERWITEARRFHNSYEQAKAEAEVVVARAVAKGSPVTVHRPSMVVGESRTGRVIHFQVFYHLVEFLSGRRTLGLIPAPGPTRLDLVPTDYLANAIFWSSRQSKTSGRILHLCSGPECAVPLLELRKRVRIKFRAAGIKVPRSLMLPAGAFRASIPLLRAFAPERQRRALSTLPTFLDYLAEDQSFSNAETIPLLGGAGITLPRASEFLDPVLDYYLRRQLERSHE